MARVSAGGVGFFHGFADLKQAKKGAPQDALSAPVGRGTVRVKAAREGGWPDIVHSSEHERNGAEKGSEYLAGKYSVNE
ncbi:MAG: hypothetical protein Q4B17_07805 [Lautropia sp.]|nr:hypothetical protein [Lautropia sp.]